MKQIFRALVVAVLLAMAGSISALGLGKLEQDSSLNERFEGRLFLLSATPDELASLKVRLADEAAFRRAGIDYAPVLRDLKFKLVEPESGSDYIHITSTQPIREPFLNFLVELNWSSGRLFREYTVLLDPPMYDPDQGRMAAPSPTTAPAPAEETTAAAPSRFSHTVIYPEDEPAGPVRSAYTPSYSGGDYGPVQSGETLWSIANAMKPAAVTTHQMMLALLRANPDAFIGNNINGLRRGAILRMPDADQMDAMSQAEALAQVRSQHGLWESARQSVAAAPATRAETASPAPADSVEDIAGESAAAQAAETESRLEVVGAEQGAAAQTGDTEGGGTDLSQQLAVANEKLQSISQENAELRDRLAENEALIEDLKRLIALKDDELASLQDRTAEEAAGVEPEVPAPQQIDGVEYPNGDPVQFIGEVPPLEALRPGPVPAAAEISHTVNRPEATPVEPAADAEAEEKAVPGPAAVTEEPEPAPEGAPDLPAAGATAAGVVGVGFWGGVMGLVGSARDFIFNNLMIAGGVVLAIIVLLAGMMFMRQRQVRIEEEADTALAAGTFPDFDAGSDLDQTSFEDDSESATEVNAAAAEAGEDQDATALTADAAVQDDDDLFVVPQGEVEPRPAAEDEEEDPLAEVNVLMAYEHFDQAESFVRNALKSEPDNVEYHAKLMEVFYAAGNKKKYEEAASDLRDLTGGQGEHWDMAVAMWQELSPNRALFEGGGDEEAPAESTGGGGGIVDITGDTAGSAEEAAKGEGTGGGLDFDLGDSTGGGTAAGGEGDEMLDLTASDETADSEMLDLTASSQDDDEGDMLDLTAAEGSAGESFEQTQSMSAAGEQDDNALDISLEGGDGSDLLDVTRSGELDSGEDLLDVTATGRGEEDTKETAENDDGNLEFSMDMETAEKPVAEEPESTAYVDDNMLEFDSDFSLDTGDGEIAGAKEKTAAAVEEDKSLEFDTSDLDLETGNESSDAGSLDEIGEELDRLEQTLGTLSHQEATKGLGSNTSDALEGIDSALEGTGEEHAAEPLQETSEAELDISLGGSETADASGEADELDISLGGSETADTGSEADELDISLGGTETVGESTGTGDDLSDLSIELDSGEDESLSPDTGSGDDEFSPDLSDLDMEFDSDTDTGEASSGNEDEISAELSELSKGLERGDLELGDEGEISLEADGEGNDFSMDLDMGDDSDGSTAGSGLEADLNSESSDTVQMDAAGTESEDSGGLDLDLSADDIRSADSIDMDSTVELPKEKLGGGLSLEGDEDDDEEDKTVFVGRSSDTEEQSLEDELTTKLDLAKAYVELGDSDSARSILEEVMKDGNEDQKRQAGELLNQL